MGGNISRSWFRSRRYNRRSFQRIWWKRSIKSICTHEKYFIPWYDLRKINIGNFKKCQTFQIDNEEYQKTRNERIEFLKSVGLNAEIFSSYIPEKYQAIPNLIWLSVIKNFLKQLEKNEDILMSYGFTNFAIPGHTEGK